MHMRDTRCVPVSGCPSFTLVYCIQMAKDIVTLFSRPGSPMFWFLEPIQCYPIPSGTPYWGH